LDGGGEFLQRLTISGVLAFSCRPVDRRELVVTIEAFKHLNDIFVPSFLMYAIQDTEGLPMNGCVVFFRSVQLLCIAKASKWR
jgi:hypothetical protein